MNSKSVARELVAVAKDLTAGQSNPDVNDIHSASQRILFSLKTLQNAAKQLELRQVLRRLRGMAEDIDEIADYLDKAWREQN